MDQRDRDDLAKREETKAQLNRILGKHGWKYETTKTVGVGVLEYQLVRTDGHTLGVRVLLSELMAFDLDDGVGVALRAAGVRVNPVLALRLLTAVKKENAAKQTA